MANFKKQEIEIFDEDFNLKKAKSIKRDLYVKKDGNKKDAKKKDGYQNDGARPYDNDQSESQEEDSDYEEFVLKIQAEAEKHPKHREKPFDMKREKNLSNRVFG